MPKRFKKTKLKTALLRVKNKLKVVEWIINSGHRRPYILSEIAEVKNRMAYLELQAKYWAEAKEY